MTREKKSLREEQARQGDAAAFGSLIRELDRDLRGVVWSIVASTDATNDVMQTAYEKAFRAIRTFDGRSSIKTWLNSICYRSAIDYVRRENLRRHEDIDQAEFGSSARAFSKASETSGVDDRLDLDARLAQLDPEQRALLMLTIGLGYSFDETAEIVGMKRGTVASKVSRARTRLSEEAQR